jgi:hypothetical protein
VKLDQDPHKKENPDPDPYFSRNSGAIEAQSGTMNLYHFDEQKDPDPHYVKNRIHIQICVKVKRGIRIRIKLMRIGHPGFNRKFQLFFKLSKCYKSGVSKQNFCML